MENYSYAASYPDSGNSSPRSREIDFENHTPWEEQSSQHPPNFKAKFMCSYGGKIQPRPHDNQLSYVGGETKILAVDRNIRFSGFITKLSAVCGDPEVCFKYQLPGEDLDALISVTNDDDLEYMMHEYDRLSRASAKPARLRLFLFSAIKSDSGGLRPGEGKTDRDKFVQALNSGPTQAVDGSSQPASVPQTNVDFLFGLEKGMQPPVPPRAVAKLQESTPELDSRLVAGVEKVIGADPVVNTADVQRQIQEMQRLQIGAPEQAMQRPRSSDNLVTGYVGEFHTTRPQEKLSHPVLPASLPVSSAVPQAYWPEKTVAGGPFQAVITTAPGLNQHQQPFYMISAVAPASPHPASMYHAPPISRPIPGQAGQGYYSVQRMPPEMYRDHTVYNVGPPTASMPPKIAPGPAPSAYPEGGGILRAPNATDAGYAQMAYDSVGRQVFYTASGCVSDTTVSESCGGQRRNESGWIGAGSGG